MSEKPALKETNLVPTGNTSLATRSSVLVRRGLETLTSQGERIVLFPKDRSIGTYYLADESLEPLVMQAMLIFGGASLQEARGTVIIPPGKDLCLKVNDDASTDLSLLNVLNSRGLHTVDLSRTQVKDTDLLHLSTLKNLKSLFLSNTQITDQGVEHLANLTQLQVLDLASTSITEAALIYLQGMTALKFLFLSNTDLTDVAVSYVRNKLPNCSIKF